MRIVGIGESRVLLLHDLLPANALCVMRRGGARVSTNTLGGSRTGREAGAGGVDVDPRADAGSESDSDMN